LFLYCIFAAITFLGVGIFQALKDWERVGRDFEFRLGYYAGTNFGWMVLGSAVSALFLLASYHDQRKRRS